MPSRTLVPVIAFFALTWFFALPLSSNPASRALDLGPDTRLFLWTLAWDVHALVRDPLSLFDANIFYPESDTLAYSEHQLGSALVAAPVIGMTGNPLLAMNLVALLSCALSGVGAYFLARELGIGRFGAFVSGIVFAFTPPRFFRLGQLHLATVQWIPFCLALLHRYARGGSTRHLLGAGLCFTLQALSGGQTGLFLALTVVALGVYLVALGEVRPRSRVLVDLGGAAALVLVLNVPFVLPYLRVQRELGLERSLSEAAVWSPNAASFVASPTHVDRALLRVLGWEERVERDAKAYLFPGLVPLVLAGLSFAKRRDANAVTLRPRSPVIDGVIISVLIGAVLIELAGGVRIGSFSASGGGRALGLALVLAGIRLAIHGRTSFAHGFVARWKAWSDARMGVGTGFYLWLGLLSLWASLGPPGVLYAALYRIVPGFDFIRVPSRLTVLSVLALAMLAGVGAERLRVKWQVRRAAVATAVVGVLLAELAAFPLDTTAYRIDPSPMDVWLGKQSETGSEPVVVLPVPDPRDDVLSARRHSTYMLSSLAHFLPLVNGYSGFTPQLHDRLFRELTRFPEGDGLSELESLGVRYAVVHRSGYSEREWSALEREAERLSDRLSLVASFPEGVVYELTRRRRGS